MKVTCIKILSPATGKNLGLKTSWLTVDNVYVVLALTFESGEISRVLIEGDDNTPKDFYINQFSIIDENEPSNWVEKKGSEGVVWKAPASWLEQDFWDRFDAGDDHAISKYLVERDLIWAEASS